MTGSRESTIEALRDRTFDALVIGGGIVGAGIARDLALRGFSVVLLEQNDLAAGTTSRPTRLIHGGLRYLEMFDFGLVRSDMREREILLSVAPHLVQPLPFLMPLYNRSQLYHAKLRAGMQLYDVLSFDKRLPSRRWLNREETLRVEPALRTEGLQGAWRFFDAQVSLVERLVVENALDAAAHGAVILTHVRMEQLRRDDRGAVVGATATDLLLDEPISISARLTVNATGPWLDRTAAGVREGRGPLLRLTKGTHLVTPAGQIANAHVLFAHGDGRLFFVVPWLGMALVGTTDTDYAGDPANAEATPEDVSYLVTEARRAFPGEPLNHVYYTYAGVRALVRVEGIREGEVSRKHALLDHQAREGIGGLLSVLGGKITAYRGIAQEVGDLVARRLGGLIRSYTEQRPLPGGRLFRTSTLAPDDLTARGAALALSRATVEHLASVYGSLAHEVLDDIEGDRSLGGALCGHTPAVLAQVVRAVEREWATTLGDVLLRRTGQGLAACQALDCLSTVASRIGEILGWDAAEREAQVETYRRELLPRRRLATATAPAVSA